MIFNFQRWYKLLTCKPIYAERNRILFFKALLSERKRIKSPWDKFLRLMEVGEFTYDPKTLSFVEAEIDYTDCEGDYEY